MSEDDALDLKTLLANADEVFGNKVVTRGASMVDVPRFPTGVFPFDFASGGGFPAGRMSLLWGHESSGKTTLALKAIGQAQQRFPHLHAVFVDVEGSYDPVHGEMCGVNNETLILARPDYAEQAVDITEQLLGAKDLSILVVDSLAALITSNELDSSADKMIVGGSALVVGRLIRKVVHALVAAAREDRYPAFIAINQVRIKIQAGGGGHGPSFTKPGGVAQNFASSLTAFMRGYKVVDKKLHPDVPAWNETTFRLDKWKVPVNATEGKFRVAIKTSKVFPAGYVEDWTTISARLKASGLMVKVGKGSAVECLGETFDKQADVRHRLKTDPAFYAATCAAISAFYEASGGVE